MRGTCSVQKPMPTNPPDRVAHTGLWKVVIYEDERFVRTDKDYIAYPEARRIAAELNGKFGYKGKAKGVA